MGKESGILDGGNPSGSKGIDDVGKGARDRRAGRGAAQGGQDTSVPHGAGQDSAR